MAVDPFSGVPATARGQMGLLFYAAVYRIVYHLRCRAAAAGRTLDDALSEYPFLASYFAEVRNLMPEDIGWQESFQWLRQAIELWERNARANGLLPLSAMRDTLGLAYEGALAFVLVGTVEEDAQFAPVFAALEGRQNTQRVSLGVLQQILGGEDNPEPWLTIKPLLDAGFLEVVNRDAPRAEWALRTPGCLWSAARGESVSRALQGAQYQAPDTSEPLSELVIDDTLRQQLTGLVSLLDRDRTRAIVVRGMPGTDCAGLIGAVARQLGRGVVQIECSVSSPTVPAPPPEDRWRLVGPFCTMTRSMPVFILDAGPGETFELPELGGYRGPVGVTIGREGGIGGAAAAHAITIQFDLEAPAQRLELWKRALNGAGQPSDLSGIASSFCLPGRYIRQCARLALDYAAVNGRTVVTPPDVRQAARAINRQVLDTLATRIDGPANWGQLIVREPTRLELKVLEGRCRHREGLAAQFESHMPGGLNRGVRAMLEGPSGTGKTLAARVLATELGLDLYRVDLAAVVNKYIGETEKNLSRVLSRAEDLNVILLLDEGDSLMTRRTDVKSANDRYANLETNYLLQRLEHYTGIVFITTNAGQSIDSAFRRRMDSVVRFHLPDAEERWQLWLVHLPAGHRVSAEVLEEMALRYQLTGGQIRNACIRAALAALKRGDTAVGTDDLKSAIKAEHRKAGATFVDRPAVAVGKNDASLAAFTGGLS
jgi:hypothetical protein